MNIYRYVKIAGLTLVLTIYMNILFAQNPGEIDRLAQVRDIVGNNQLIMVWSQSEDQNEHYSHQRIYNLDITRPEIEERLIPGQVHSDSLVTGARQMAVATGDFLGTGPEHFAAAWSGPDTSITIIIPDIDSGTLRWTDAQRVIIPGPLYSDGSGSSDIHLAAGDYSGNDRKDELVLAYHGADSTVHLHMVNFQDGSLSPELGGEIHGEKLSIDQVNFDIVTGNFNGDASEEVALLFVKPIDSGHWAVSVRIYSYSDQEEFVPLTSEEIFYRPEDQRGEVRISGTSGNFDSDSNEEIALAFTSDTDGFGGDDTYLYILDVQENLQKIVFNPEERFAEDYQTENLVTPLNIATGDLNGDFRDEIVLVTSGSTRIFTIDANRAPTYQLTRPAASPADPSSSYGNEEYFLAVGDMFGSGYAVIVTAAHHRNLAVDGSQYFEVMVMRLDSTLRSSELIARRQRIEEVPTDGGRRSFAIALGDFSGERTWLGPPQHHRRTALLQPSVILNAPPVHYDILNETTYDISGCYPNQGCGFISSYTQTTTNEQTVAIEIHEDWGVSAGVEIVAPGSKTKLTTTYGEKFSNTDTRGQSITISTGRTATGDDWIFANLYDIDFYEYPVYSGQDTTPAGYYLVSVPNNIRPLWIEGKNDQLLGNQFRPDHEVGNILSYRRYAADPPPDLDSLIVEFQEQTVGATGNSFVALQQSTFTDNKAATSWEAGAAFEQSIGETGDFYGIELGFHVNFGGKYQRGEILTQTVSVKENLEIRSDFGHVQPAIGTSGTYYVSPYAYWTGSGALVLDYKVAIPEGNSFWQERYGASDLAFSLPWRYDEQKGIPFPADDLSYRNRTRDLVLSDPEPGGGDTVTVGARIRNLGLEDAMPPIKVDFYLGDPKSGGAHIAVAEIDTIVPARGTRNVFVEWYIPPGTPLDDARIYAKIDPDNATTDEIHEENNTGWAPVIPLGTRTYTAGGPSLPEQCTLYQAYPNPFNSQTAIRFDLNTTAHVTLKVYNILGQEVVTLIDERREAGMHEASFHAIGLATGLYFYGITANPQKEGASVFRETRKMLYLK